MPANSLNQGYFTLMENIMNQIIYLVGLVVIVMAILSFVGIH